jgi:hypothetical protein
MYPGPTLLSSRHHRHRLSRKWSTMVRAIQARIFLDVGHARAAGNFAATAQQAKGG